MPPDASADDELSRWLADEQVVRARMEGGKGPGVTPAHEALAMDGLTLMQRMLHGEVHHAPIGRSMHYLLIEVAHGRAVFQGEPRDDFLNPLGTVHGGWFATLLDSALGCAVHTTLPAGRAYTTAEISVRMVRAITPKLPRVRAIGEVVHAGRQMATAEARLVGPDGTLYAHGSTTCLIFDAKR